MKKGYQVEIIGKNYTGKKHETIITALEETLKEILNGGDATLVVNVRELASKFVPRDMFNQVVLDLCESLKPINLYDELRRFCQGFSHPNAFKVWGGTDGFIQTATARGLARYLYSQFEKDPECPSITLKCSDNGVSLKITKVSEPESFQDLDKSQKDYLVSGFQNLLKEVFPNKSIAASLMELEGGECIMSMKLNDNK